MRGDGKEFVMREPLQLEIRDYARAARQRLIASVRTRPKSKAKWWFARMRHEADRAAGPVGFRK